LGGARAAKQEKRYCLEQPSHGAWLVEKRLSLPQRDLFDKQVIAVAGEIENSERGFGTAQTIRQFVAVHLRHHDIGEQQVESAPAPGGLQGPWTVEGDRRLVAGVIQD